MIASIVAYCCGGLGYILMGWIGWVSETEGPELTYDDNTTEERT